MTVPELIDALRDLPVNCDFRTVLLRVVVQRSCGLPDETLIVNLRDVQLEPDTVHLKGFGFLD